MPLGRLTWKRQTIVSIHETVKKSETSYTAAGNIKWYSHFGKQSGNLLKSYTQSYFMIQKFHSLVSVREMKMYIHKKNLYMKVHSGIFIIQPKLICPSTDEWTNKMQCLECYSALKWMKYRYMLHEWSLKTLGLVKEVTEDHTGWFHLQKLFWVGKPIERKSRLVAG